MNSSFNALYLMPTFEVLTYEPKFFRYELDFFRDTGLFPATVSVATLTHNVIGDQPTIGLRQAVRDQVLILHQLENSFCLTFMQSWVEVQLAPAVRNLVSQHITHFKPVPNNFVSEWYRASGQQLISQFYLQVVSPIDQLSYLYFTSPCSVTGQPSIHSLNPNNFAKVRPVMEDTLRIAARTPIAVDYSQGIEDSPGRTADNTPLMVEHALLSAENFRLFSDYHIELSKNRLLTHTPTPLSQNEVTAKVVNDWRIQQAHLRMAELARQAAEILPRLGETGPLSADKHRPTAEDAQLTADIKQLEVDNAGLEQEAKRLSAENIQINKNFCQCFYSCYIYTPFYGSVIDLQYWDEFSILYGADKKLTAGNRREHVDLFWLNAQGTLHQPYSTSFAACETFVKKAPEWGGLHMKTHPFFDSNGRVLGIGPDGVFDLNRIPDLRRIQSIYRKTSLSSIEDLREIIYGELQMFFSIDELREAIYGELQTLELESRRKRSALTVDRFISELQRQNITANRYYAWLKKPNCTLTHGLDFSQSCGDRYVSCRQRIRITKCV